jgi:hypothetical protein
VYVTIQCSPETITGQGLSEKFRRLLIWDLGAFFLSIIESKYVTTITYSFVVKSFLYTSMPLITRI